MADFDNNTYISFLLAGKPREAEAYLTMFPEKQELARQLTERMEGNLVKRSTDQLIDRIDQAYQRYWRKLFWQGLDKVEAGETLLSELASLAKAELPVGPLDERISAVEGQLREIAEARGFHYLGGRTMEYYGPYIWKTTTPERHRVELPAGTQDYTVYMLGGFVSCSWLEYISLGRISTGGWQSGEGQMFCVEASYPKSKRKGANFQVSLLKHEAQHAWDGEHHPELSPVMLEYRAKLVELIYYPRLSLFLEFLAEAECQGNAHSMAAYRIVQELSQRIFGKAYVGDSRRWKGKLGKIREQSRECLKQSLEPKSAL